MKQITLSQQQSERIHALLHLIPFCSENELLENLLFSTDPDNFLECLSEDFSGAQLRRIESFTNRPLDQCFRDWDSLVQAVETIAPYSEENYPERIPDNVISIMDHLEESK